MRFTRGQSGRPGLSPRMEFREKSAVPSCNGRGTPVVYLCRGCSTVDTAARPGQSRPGPFPARGVERDGTSRVRRSFGRVLARRGRRRLERSGGLRMGGSARRRSAAQPVGPGSGTGNSPLRCRVLGRVRMVRTGQQGEPLYRAGSGRGAVGAAIQRRLESDLVPSLGPHRTCPVCVEAPYGRCRQRRSNSSRGVRRCPKNVGI